MNFLGLAGSSRSPIRYVPDDYRGLILLAPAAPITQRYDIQAPFAVGISVKARLRGWRTEVHTDCNLFRPIHPTAMVLSAAGTDGPVTGTIPPIPPPPGADIGG